jgi:hypothetical protein
MKTSDRVRPTDAEFEELKRKRDEALSALVDAVCKREGLERSKVSVHASHSDGCYCACPDGPCQHEWNGPDYTSDDGCMISVTCSRCGAIAAYHDMRCAP